MRFSRLLKNPFDPLSFWERVRVRVRGSNYLILNPLIPAFSPREKVRKCFSAAC